MISWIFENAATIVICGIILVLMILAVIYIIKSHKNGGCAGCPAAKNCGGACCHCQSKKSKQQ